MEDQFEIPIVYKGEALSFSALLITFGYSYKIQVDVNGLVVFFEPDEEKNFRVVLDYQNLSSNKEIDKSLLQVICKEIEQLVA